jgi:hypothetical protein
VSLKNYRRLKMVESKLKPISIVLMVYFSRIKVYLTNQKVTLTFIVILSLLIVLWRLPLLDKPLDDDSAANAYGARLILQGEPLYSTYHPGHHMPAIYYIYTLAFMLIGDSPAAIRFFLSLWLIPTAYLLYVLARTLVDQKGSWLAVIFFVLLTSDYTLEGHAPEIEQFANLPRIGATLLLITFLNSKTKDWYLLWIGLVAAICFLLKAVYVTPLILSGVVLLTQFWSQRSQAGVTYRLIKQLLWLGAGLALGFMPVIAYFGVIGLLPRLALVFTLGQGHVSLTDFSPLFIFLFPLSGLAIANLPLLILALAGALLMPLDKSLPIPSKYLIPLWLFLSFIEAGLSRKAFPHYYLLITPALCLIAAWLVTQPYRLLKSKAIGLAVPLILLCAIGGVYLFINGGYLSHYVRYKTGQETYRDFVLNSWPPVGSMFVALQDIATYIKIHSDPEDRIYIYSEEVQLYYLTNRRCALDFIWIIYLEHPAIPGGLPEMQRRLFAPTTEFIVIAQPDPPAWLTTGLAKDYHLVETIAERQIYQRNGS